jgi:two-component system, OmpR family, alkaline phosphatase synthesis response regulator PhoP
VVRLRRYIEPEPSRPKHLLTVRGVGYRFNANPKS